MIKNVYLLPVLVFLVAYRFLYVPYSEFLDGKRSELQLAQNKNDKIELLVSREGEIKQYRESLIQVASSYRGSFKQVASLDDFKLSLQQDIQNAAVASGARVELYDWTFSEKSNNSSLEKANITVKVAGKPAAIAQFQSWLDSQQFVLVQSVRLSWSAFLAGYTDVNAQAELVVLYSQGSGDIEEKP